MTTLARRLGFALLLTAAGAAGVAVGSVGWCYDRWRRRWCAPGTWREVDELLIHKETT